jgi:hypothetical protein
MGKVAIVDGVKIIFYPNEHPPPHFHAKCAEFQAVVHIDSTTIIAGRLPPAQARSVLNWAASRKAQLRVVFAATMDHKKVGPIE